MHENRNIRSEGRRGGSAVKRPSQDEGLDIAGEKGENVKWPCREKKRKEKRERERESSGIKERKSETAGKKTARRQRREGYRTKAWNSINGDVSRVEDNVWFRAIIEETLGDVEGPDEIFSSKTALSFRKKDRDSSASVIRAMSTFRAKYFVDTFL